MAKGKTKKGGGRRRGSRRTRKQKAVLSITGMLVIIWLLQRMGLLTKTAWDFLMAGNLGGLVGHLETSVKDNFTGTGMGTTLASGISLAVVVAIIRLVAKGKTVPLRKPSAISA